MGTAAYSSDATSASGSHESERRRDEGRETFVENVGSGELSRKNLKKISCARN